MSALFVMLGGALGAIARYSLTLVDWPSSRDVPGQTPRFPWATFVANVSASLLLGVVIRLVGSGMDSLSLGLVAFFVTGFCGALSTMSTFMVEVFLLTHRGATVSALGYLAISLGASLLAFWVGLVLTVAVSG